MTTMPAKVILIVEDEKAIRDMIAFGLRRGGFDTREAQDCRAARTEIPTAIAEEIAPSHRLRQKAEMNSGYCAMA